MTGAFLLAVLALANATDVQALEPSDLLAPGPVELDLALTEMEARLDRADAAATALVRTHNAIGEALAVSQGRLSCDAPALALVARTEPLGGGYRDRVQAARAQGQRVIVIAAAPTVSALSDGPVKGRITTALARLAAHERGYAELDAWQKRFVAPIVHRCHPMLGPSAGIGAPDSGRVAVVVMGATLCPEGVKADGFALADGPACAAPSASCECTPEAQAPGAVLGIAR
jgi:hypothetical protein